MLNVTLYLTKDFQLYVIDVTVCIARNVKLVDYNIMCSETPYNHVGSH